MLFNTFVIFIANYSLLSDTMLSSNLYNFHTLSLNSLASSSTDVSSVIAMKCIIFDNLLQTTKIAYFPATNSSFVIKSTVRCIHGFSGILLNFSFPAGTSILFSFTSTYHTSPCIFPPS